MKTPLFAAMMLALSVPGLTACSGETQDAAAPADENAIAGLEVTNARMILPAVAGNPAVVYFDIANKGERNLAFRSAEVEGAGRAEMHDTMMQGDKMVMGEAPPLMIEAGGTVTFEPGGRHVMVFDLGDGLTEGSTTTVTLIAAGNKRHSFEAPVQGAGEAR